MWSGNENVVEQERRERGQHTGSERRRTPCARAEALQASSPQLRS
jgi:hypothetical protein